MTWPKETRWRQPAHVYEDPWIEKRRAWTKKQGTRIFQLYRKSWFAGTIRKIKSGQTIEEVENIPDTVWILWLASESQAYAEIDSGVLQYSQTDLMHVTREPTDLNGAGWVLNDLSETIEENSIQIERDQLPVLNLLRLQFVQLFANIISNAIKYRRENLPLQIKISSSLEKGSGELASENHFIKSSYPTTELDSSRKCC